MAYRYHIMSVVFISKIPQKKKKIVNEIYIDWTSKILSHKILL